MRVYVCVRVRVYVRVCVCACLPLSLACPPAAGRPVQSPQPQRTSMKDLMASSGEVFGLSVLGYRRNMAVRHRRGPAPSVDIKGSL